jgi:ribosomal protein S18 acetylase RimI-like enzyme
MPMPTTLAGLARAVRMRPLHTDDHAACLALWRQCDGLAVRMWEDASAMTRLIERNPAMSCAAEVAGQLVGTVLCGHDGWRGWLYHVAVDPMWRRRGLATALVSRAQAELSKAGIRRVHALMLSGNRDAMQFWSAAGWRQREDLSVVSFEFSAATLN